jgi:hypothetical protein
MVKNIKEEYARDHNDLYSTPLFHQNTYQSIASHPMAA